MDNELTLEQALLAAQLGDKKRARSILRAVIRQEPHNEKAWLLYADFAEKPEQATAWVEHTLKINPNNVMARQKLAVLGTSTGPKALQPRQTPEQIPPAPVPIKPSGAANPPNANFSAKARILGGGCLAVVGLIFLCVAIGAISETGVYLNWQAGVEAYNQGKCGEANARFQRVIDSPNLGIVNVSSQANQLRSECAAFLKAVDEESAGRYGPAFARYIDFSKLYPASGLGNYVAQRVEAIFSKAPLEELAVEAVCDRIAWQGETELIPQPDARLPELYYYCGRMYEEIGELENAGALYYVIRTDYPAHPISSLATQGLARVEISLAGNAPTLAPPLESGTAPAGTSVYVVQNDSPEQVEIILSGPETIIKEIAECSVCTKLTSDPVECPNLGPRERITLKPGDYEVLVKSASDDEVIPYQGKWTFQDGIEYAHCYYVLTTVVP
jgi:tetratricopeptide (TPR) repeat protein